MLWELHYTYWIYQSSQNLYCIIHAQCKKFFHVIITFITLSLALCPIFYFFMHCKPCGIRTLFFPLKGFNETRKGRLYFVFAYIVTICGPSLPFLCCEFWAGIFFQRTEISFCSAGLLEMNPLRFSPCCRCLSFPST